MSDDPLDGADIGETATVSRTEEIWLGDLEADHARGSDRMSDPSVTDVEVVTDDWGDEVLRVTVESDVTKRLPRRWDASDQPRTDAERTQALRSRVASALATVVPTAIALGIGLAVTNRVMSGLAGEVVINGEPLTYSPWDLVPVVVLVLVMVGAIVGIQHLPRPGPRGDRR